MKLYVKSLIKFQKLFDSNEYLQAVLTPTMSNVYFIETDADPGTIYGLFEGKIYKVFNMTTETTIETVYYTFNFNVKSVNYYREYSNFNSNVFITLENGDVYVQGDNAYGELGLNHTNPVTTYTKHPILKNVDNINVNVGKLQSIVSYVTNKPLDGFYIEWDDPNYNIFTLDETYIEKEDDLLTLNSPSWKYAVEYLYVPYGIEVIGSFAFESSTNLKQALLGASVKVLKAAAFAGTKLTNINLENIEVIEDWAFSEVVGNQFVQLGPNLTYLGSAVFENSNIVQLYLQSLTPPTIKSDTFADSIITHIYIPMGTLYAYQNAPNWGAHSSKLVEMPY